QTQGVVLYAATAILGLAALHALRLMIYLGGAAPIVSILLPSPWGLFFMVCGAVTIPAVFLALLLLIQTSLAEQMQAALTFDNLTRAYSRRSIRAEIDHELQRCTRSGKVLGMLVLDIDHFKTVNDKYGHAAGDTALRHFTQVVQSTVRATDRFGRLGGEEFVLLMPDCSPASALRQAHRVREAIGQTRLHLEHAVVSMTVSGGLASFQHGDTADEILARADAALYRAKESGRNQIHVAFGDIGPTPIYAGIDVNEFRATTPRSSPVASVQLGQSMNTA
ncbi:GGDEF domain-containing protein, partial [Achromobacter anxifer]|uniref:GGDEF domain-containing protein n=1 Tax=Achromobacter anxifer TaxID=1287737 RepID=UPI0023F72FEE